MKEDFLASHLLSSGLGRMTPLANPLSVFLPAGEKDMEAGELSQTLWSFCPFLEDEGLADTYGFVVQVPRAVSCRMSLQIYLLGRGDCPTLLVEY